MLKLHHMNLLNEIQETTLMMNLYQQQQLQQQQQQLQQQASAEQLGGAGADTQLSMLMQQQNGAGGQGLDPLFGASQLQQRASLGLGGPQMGGFGGPQSQSGMVLPQQNNGSSSAGITQDAGNDDIQNRMPAIKAEVNRGDNNNNSKLEGEASGTTAESDASPTKRSADGGEQPPVKRVKTEEGGEKDETPGDTA